ncbi:LysM peptidoglycan-binding domain-containing protein [Desulfosporosinus sp. Sb-LF]|uniref:LysM peptidoglycan-binding domain-containing protein n=1 Tax=Desulfosporosinus sp. Sb-LF TaxID=2560027 RepID=UPI00107F7C05|nr:LysM peptidoglycan-binding domain-containing protein [Desulfosporosinus sp. Sb-LF]TGE32668.1 LysM peptidoglycan-binding domain-containing protein [Desulfosporosinus sp. Sb-LF]
MELRSVAYNPTLTPGMGGMPGMQQDMQGMGGMQAMPGMHQDMQGMGGMQAMPGMHQDMQGMSGMQAMPGMQPGMQGMGGMHGMPEMERMLHGMHGVPGGCQYQEYDPCCPMPCPPYNEPMHHEHYEHHCPMPEPTPAHEVYVVKKGDSIYKIAKRYGTTMQAIILANNLRNPNLIYPGQILFIPGVATSEFYG